MGGVAVGPERATQRGAPSGPVPGRPEEGEGAALFPKALCIVAGSYAELFTGPNSQLLSLALKHFT